MASFQTLREFLDANRIEVNKRYVICTKAKNFVVVKLMSPSLNPQGSHDLEFCIPESLAYQEIGDTEPSYAFISEDTIELIAPEEILVGCVPIKHLDLETRQVKVQDKRSSEKLTNRENTPAWGFMVFKADHHVPQWQMSPIQFRFWDFKKEEWSSVKSWAVYAGTYYAINYNAYTPAQIFNFASLIDSRARNSNSDTAIKAIRETIKNLQDEEKAAKFKGNVS